MLYKRPLFTFQEYGGFKALQAMPHVLWYIHAVSPLFLTDNAGFQNFTVIIIGCDSDLTFQYYEGLCFCGMMVYWYLGARFQCVEEAVALVLKALVEIVVLCKQSGRAERILSLGDFFASSATCVSRVSSIIFISLSLYRA